MLVLGIDTSCDETAVSVVRDGQEILSNIVASQVIHSKYGGVIPEAAARAHIQAILPITEIALKVANISLRDINLIGVTNGPGLIGSLLCGLSFAKALSFSLNVPFCAVNHLVGHIYSLILEYKNPPLPMIVLLISGGHTELYLLKENLEYELLGQTMDDACGEAFDKVAKMLNKPYPGGPYIEKLAKKGKRNINFPIPVLKNYNFSFSGLKTAVLYYLKENPSYNEYDVAHSFQETVIDYLILALNKASEEFNIKNIGVVGGVAVNERLKERLNLLAQDKNYRIFIPRKELCLDNGAMIACASYYQYQKEGPSDFSVEAFAN
ncbi:MAG: tRNA (adenosine(37)-N6)-threonylcarbamoyltransferase complex transferase subunit TsaD [candidate division WOR-3 bacterium]|nr:tRNA (adenosine(37)-N6)-threonylcarbamoyltransferase complex transferase subunit TsaD [candidate division WOR-3 bacterium]MCX7836842.1 tRNA (adenosine(37)-N6)-threonylcarbamoyltransferase complex transferase subunit TsaD [candidate division WOR-3 bacterium]MDW8114289.1 tRNA (adenosine(37)-N6)-threonylcarbamoyltransferase complex transferase subunit TsaD [candidate division WOR-3 bacterium]